MKLILHQHKRLTQYTRFLNVPSLKHTDLSIGSFLRCELTLLKLGFTTNLKMCDREPANTIFHFSTLLSLFLARFSYAKSFSSEMIKPHKCRRSVRYYSHMKAVELFFFFDGHKTYLLITF